MTGAGSGYIDNGCVLNPFADDAHKLRRTAFNKLI